MLANLLPQIVKSP